MLLRRLQFDRDLDEEMRLHLALRQERLRQEGFAPEDAKLAARRRFGNVLSLRERSRDAWGWGWLEQLAQDVRVGARTLRKNPGFTTVAILTLALGLGVNAAIFSLTREVLLRPLPYRDADRLVRVFETSDRLGRRGAPVAPANYVAWRDRVHAFEQTVIFRRVAFNVAMKTSAVQVEGFLVDAGFFPMLGVEPALGRGFTDEDTQPSRDAVVLLSDGFWRRQFAADPAIVGQTIHVDGTLCAIVGVLPPSFKIYRVLNRELDVFRPFAFDPTDREQSLNVYAKLKPTVSLDNARAQMRAAYSSLNIPDQLWTGDTELLSTSFAAQSRAILLALQWAVGLVLLIACANIANLLLAVSAGRRRELALRQALGASGWRIARDLAGETLVLAVMGGVLAILLAMWIVAVLNANVSFQDINRLQPFRVDGWVVAFTSGLTILVTLGLSLLPGRVARDIQIVDALKDSTLGVTAGVSNRRLRQALIVGELALSLVLTVSAVALTRSALTLHGLQRGVTVDHVMTAQVSLQGPGYDDTERLVHAATAMRDRLGGSPGIAAASLVNYPPLALIRLSVPVSIEGHSPPAGDQPWIVRYWVVAPHYFRTAGIPILAGRDFVTADDGLRPGVAIVSEAFARRFWNSTDVLGRRLKPEFPQSTAFWIPRARRDLLTIIGVVGNVREDGLRGVTSLAQLYLPYAQNPTTTVTLMARTTGLPPETVAPAIREAVRAVDPQSPVSFEQSFEEVIHESFARPREMAWLVGAFAGLALILSAVGLYGVMAYLAAARTREIGIRMALGAQHAEVMGLVLGQSLVLTTLGIALGFGGAAAATRYLEAMLFGLTPLDPTTFVAAALIFALVAMLASYVPARRATKVDPLIALRYE
jgi:putative ABC transport system permease protein